MIIVHGLVEFLFRDVTLWGELRTPVLSWLGSVGLMLFFGWHLVRLYLESARAGRPILRLRDRLVPMAQRVESTDLQGAFERAFSDEHGITMSDPDYTPGETDLDRLTALDRAMREVPAFRRPWVQFRKTLLIERVPWSKEPRIFSTRQAGDFFTQEAVVGGHVDLGFYAQVPSLITGLGLLLTFVAICTGLSRVHSDGQTIIGIQGLINGLSGKFLTSIVGLGCANAFVLLERPVVDRLVARHNEFLALLEESFPRRTVEDLLDELRRGRVSRPGADGPADPIEALTAAVRALTELLRDPQAAPLRAAVGGPRAVAPARPASPAGARGAPGSGRGDRVVGAVRSGKDDWRSAGQPAATGLTDLMTSLAVIFVLLLVVFASVPHPVESPRPMTEPDRPPADVVRAPLQQAVAPGLTLEADPEDPQSLRVVIPERFLNFDFGKATLTTSADRFLGEVMPVFAAAVCGPTRALIAGIVIEGHTDDLGGDALNLRLSQERSFQVLVRGLQAIQATGPAVYACFSQLASASGRGKQDVIYDSAQRPNRELSRRVVFKILLRPRTAPVGVGGPA